MLPLQWFAIVQESRLGIDALSFSDRWFGKWHKRSSLPIVLNSCLNSILQYLLP